MQNSVTTIENSIEVSRKQKNTHTHKRHMTKQGLFQNHKHGWMTIRKSIKYNLSGQSVLPWIWATGPPTPALLLPKGKGFLWARRTCPVFLLSDHIFDTKTPKSPAPMAPSPFPGPIPILKGGSSHQNSTHPTA